MSGPEQLGQAPGLAIVRRSDGTTVLDWEGGPYVRLDPARWAALVLAMGTSPPLGRPTGTGWPPGA